MHGSLGDTAGGRPVMRDGLPFGERLLVLKNVVLH
jgi:hypothetical protein